MFLRRGYDLVFFERGDGSVGIESRCGEWRESSRYLLGNWSIITAGFIFSRFILFGRIEFYYSESVLSKCYSSTIFTSIFSTFSSSTAFFSKLS